MNCRLAPRRSQRREMELHLDRMKAQLATQDAALARLQGEEAQAVSNLATEQARWNDFNARLDELERSRLASTHAG